MDSSAWDERYASAELVWSRRPNTFVERELDDLPPGRALDVACGEGRNAIWLASLGWQVTAVDFSFVAIDKARRLSAAAEVAVDWRVEDALTGQLPSGVDLVLLAYLQLTAPERRVVVRRAAQALAPGGTLFVIAHDTSNLTEGSGGPQDAGVLYTPDDLLADLSDLSGLSLEVERAEVVERPVDGARPARDALLRARRGAAGPAA